MSNPEFQFNISLSVLNHLGRNLYRNFITVLGEAISNSWDADANNVWITIDKANAVFSIKDDGDGMNADDFRSKFLKIGYSKRKEGGRNSKKGRPFIGAKGIGKLAMLSCAKRVSIFTKKKGAEYLGGVIDNGGLDEAIKQDLVPDQYPLEALDFALIEDLKAKHDKGTIIVFEGANEVLRNSEAYIKKLLAMSFKFSLLDKNFNIHVNGEAISLDDLSDLMGHTQFVWNINEYIDDYVEGLKNLEKEAVPLTYALDIKGFIASVKKPSNLKIRGTEERATIDLFVNGRLRERNILRHIPTQRVVESYLYGQIHFDAMDRSDEDPFTSSREGILEDDSNFRALMKLMKDDLLPLIIDQWDKLRLEVGQEGDDENARKSKRQRKARDLYSLASEEYTPGKDKPGRKRVDKWLAELQSDAEFNISSYVDCFLSENLVRKYIQTNKIKLTPDAAKRVAQFRKHEGEYKDSAGISYSVRKNDDDLSYLDMNDLAGHAEVAKKGDHKASLWSDARKYRPVRNAVGHTGLLTDVAKADLNVTFHNIKARVAKLIALKKKGD